MITSTEEIQKLIEGMEKQIKANSEYIDVLSVFKDTALSFNGKVINKRFTDEINANLPMWFSSCYCSFNQYGKSYQYTVYQRDHYSENYTKCFSFPLADCFTVTDSGKHRIKADAFSDRCQQIRQAIIEENAKIRNDIDSVWQMLRDAQELMAHFREYDSKYNYGLKLRFKCAFSIR